MSKILSFLIALTVVLHPSLVRGQATVSISDTTTIVGENLFFPVLLVNDGNEVTGINFTISYDSLALNYVGASENATISDSVLSIDNGADGTIRFSLASTYPIRSSGTIVNLEFISRQTGDTELSIKEYRINEDELMVEAGTARIRVFGEAGNQPPFALNIPDTLVLISGDTLSFTIDETYFADAEDEFDSLDIQVSIDPEVVFGTFDEETGLVTITTADFVGFALLNLRVVDTDGGVFEESIVIDIQLGVSSELENDEMVINFHLDQNYPNPFNPSTTIGFTLSKSGFTQLEVYNLQGQKVATLIKNRLTAGRHTVSFDAGEFASGIYIYRLTSGNEVITKKMLLIK